MGRLDGRVAAITGGASGIGRAIAERFLAEGARVAIGQLEADTHSAPAGAEMWELDVRDPTAVTAFVARTAAACGGLDVAVSNAAITGPPAIAPLMEHSVELFRDILATNLVGPFLFAQAAARVMIDAGKGGSIINIASVDSFIAEEFAAGYVSAKSGLVGLTRACAVELAPHGITANAIAPGQIFSEAGSAADRLREDDAAPAYRHYREAPLGAGGQPIDVAGAAVFLASADARWVSGTTLVVDGGFLAS
jgi:NAD(P)-dependent dehydrogenase (short-subunit alcohol dehydrogenase family)